MPEGGSVICLKITEFLQKSRDLHNNSEDILIGGVVVHAEPFHSFVVFNNRVETFLFQFLPILAQLIFIVGVE